MFELIPLKPGSLLACRKSKLSTLKLLLNIASESLEACKAFIDKKYIDFDAQVGETSCQIRAYKICLLASSQRFISELPILALQITKYRNYLVGYTQEFEANMLTHAKYSRELDQKETKEDFFNKLQITELLSDDCLFIILAHFLNKYCLFDSDDIPNAIDYNLIKTTLNIGSTPARHVANHYQSMLSALSCDFILQQYTHARMVEQVFLHKLLKIGDRHRVALPYYFVTKILLSGSTVNFPIVFSLYNSQEVFPPRILFFKKDYYTDKVVLQSELNDIDRHTPAIIFRGDISANKILSFSDFKNNLLQIDLQKIILFNAASHPQYTGTTLQDFVVNPYKDIISDDLELEKLIATSKEELILTREQAEILGCSQKNLGLFYIKHIFCSTFDNEWNALFYKGGSLCLNQQHSVKPDNRTINI